jgi:hypothetical protein
MGRRPLGLVVAGMVVAALAIQALPAGAASDWDPNDVRGRLDLRWVAATYTADHDIRLTVALYPGFRLRDLPKKDGGSGVLWMSFDKIFTGWFVRRHGGLAFRFGDTASSCCLTFPARRLDPLTLRTTITTGDAGDPGIRIRAKSRWGGSHGPLDWTGEVLLPPLDNREPTNPCTASATVVGTFADDVLTGTPGPDVIDAGSGNDVIRGLGGDDRLCGGTGSDRLLGGPGDDSLHPGRGEGASIGGRGNDAVRWEGQEGALDVRLDRGFAESSWGRQQLRGIETVVGTRFQDILVGSYRSERLLGGGSGDDIRGEGGDDILVAGLGHDRIAGGAGDDLVIVGEARGGQLTALGGPGADRIVGTSNGDHLSGGVGRDSVHGRGGNDALSGGVGRDVGDGGAGTDSCGGFEVRRACEA